MSNFKYEGTEAGGVALIHIPSDAIIAIVWRDRAITDRTVYEKAVLPPGMDNSDLPPLARHYAGLPSHCAALLACVEAADALGGYAHLTQQPE